MFQLDVGKLARHVGDHFAPQAGTFQNIRFVDGGDFLPASLRRFERQSRDAFHFVARVAHGVQRTVDGFLAWLAVIQSSGELAEHDQIDAGDPLGTQRREFLESWKNARGPKIRPQSQGLAQTEQARFRTPRGWLRVEFRKSYGAEKNSVAFQRELARDIRQRLAGRVNRSAADESFGEMEFMRGTCGSQNFDRDGGDLWANAVAGKNSYFECHFVLKCGDLSPRSKLISSHR